VRSADDRDGAHAIGRRGDAEVGVECARGGGRFVGEMDGADLDARQRAKTGGAGDGGDDWVAEESGFIGGCGYASFFGVDDDDRHPRFVVPVERARRLGGAARIGAAALLLDDSAERRFECVARDRARSEDAAGPGGDRAIGVDVEREDGGFDADAAGATVEDEQVFVRKLGGDVLRPGGAGPTEAVGRRRRKGADAAEDFERGGVVGRADADGVEPGGDDVGRRGRAGQDERERAGPVAFGETSGGAGPGGGHASGLVGVGDVNDERVEKRSALDGEDAAEGVVVVNARGEAVHGFGGQRAGAAALKAFADLVDVSRDARLWSAAHGSNMLRVGEAATPSEHGALHRVRSQTRSPGRSRAFRRAGYTRLMTSPDGFDARTGSTLLCVPIMVEDPAEALAAAQRAKELGADLVEYRLDHLFSGEGDDEGQAACLDVVARSPLPCVATCRPVWEGGGYDGDDSARVSLFEALGAAERGPAYIDVEAMTYSRSANLRQKVNLAVKHPNQLRDVGTRLILSRHDFDGRPTGLLRAVNDIRLHEAASVIKIAFTARTVRDNVEVFELLREKDRPTIALAMGEDGLMSRVLAPKFGAFLTFASLERDAGTAPGQPTIDELLDLYNFRSISPTTKVYGVIGDPVSHSASPAVHNAAFARTETDAVYLPIRINAGWESFKAGALTLLGERKLDFAGASVTIPHKEHLLRLAREHDAVRWQVDDAAELAGAANTLAMLNPSEGRLANTDATALAGIVREALGRTRLDGLRVALLGSGGVARAAAAGLALEGAAVTVCARNEAKRSALADELGEGLAARHGAGRVEHAGWEDRHNVAGVAAAVINCTPIGMESAGGGGVTGSGSGGEGPTSPLELERLPTGAAPLIVDTVYTPPRTALLSAAAERGLTTASGLELFARQAAEQSRLWTGRELGVEFFRSRAEAFLRTRHGA